MPLRNALFDLDGTLTEPALGITNCYRFALESLGRPAPAQGDLLKFIGPPMRQSFAGILGADDAELIERAVALYRERFARVGLYENEVYAGVREMLEGLRAAGLRLFVATSKVTEYSVRVLEHFDLAGFFVSVHGATPDGSLDDKALLVARLLREEGLDPAESVMIGDREHDIIAARRNSLRAVGVAYGYGSRAELVEAGAEVICDSPAGVAALLLGRKPRQF
ncbi:MAG TPA: HAD hydrolase-like protein [Pyrinomonadaceae bacterium]|jgi:phosphoglycolate phosphatase|nr:HAD hydrolase-like protein [Pyrinomonadaceae bacterium]